MPLPLVSYTADVVLIRELVYEAPAEMGVRKHRVALDLVWDDDAEQVSDALALAQMPPEAWGWCTQERFHTVVRHEDTDYELSSLILSESPRTFVDAHEITPEMVDVWMKNQIAYRKSCEKLGRALGPLPHGKDVSPLVVAFEHGDRIVETRHGHRRRMDPGDRMIPSTEGTSR